MTIKTPTRDPRANVPQTSSQRENAQTSSNRQDDPSIREEERLRLALAHQKLVMNIARQVHSRLPPSVELEDLVNEGFLGLLEAIDRYDGYRSVPLHIFAARRIRGAILDQLRALDWVPRTVRRRAATLEKTRDTLHIRLGRAPNREEMADRLGLDAGQFERMERNAEIRRIGSLDACIASDGDMPLIDTLTDDEDIVGRRCDDETMGALLSAIDRLPEKERTAVRRFYLEERPLTEVGRELGVSESRASQLHRHGVDRLRHKIREHIGA